MTDLVHFLIKRSHMTHLDHMTKNADKSLHLIHFLKKPSHKIFPTPDQSPHKTLTNDPPGPSPNKTLTNDLPGPSPHKTLTKSCPI
jgi:hypothetical protein